MCVKLIVEKDELGVALGAANVIVVMMDDRTEYIHQLAGLDEMDRQLICDARCLAVDGSLHAAHRRAGADESVA